MKAASVGTYDYAPHTSFEFTVNAPDTYNLTGVQARFEIDRDGLTYKLLEEGVAISKSGQYLLVNIGPYTTGDNGNIFEEAISGHAYSDYCLDLLQSGSSVVDYRIQGKIHYLPNHGIL